MVREIEAIENVPLRIEMTAEEAHTLSGLGRELSARTTWWGDVDAPRDRAVIQLQGASGGRYRVDFKNVVGVVRVGRYQIHVLPKIPQAHFWYIVNQSEIAPRVSEAQLG